MIKLTYHKIQIKDLTIYYAKYRKNRSLRLTIDRENTIKVTCPYLTPEYEIENFVLRKEDWIRNIISKNENSKEANVYRKLTRQELKELKNKIIPIVKKYEVLMGTTVAHITLRDMKTRWGSCTFKTHRIRLSTKLYFTTDEFLEYIIVHEMTHIFVPNHSKAFYDMVKKYIPNYKKITKEPIK